MGWTRENGADSYDPCLAIPLASGRADSCILRASQPPHLFHRRIWLDRRTAALVASLDGKRDISQYIRTPGFQKLLREGIVTDRSLLRTSPSSLEDAAYCVRCAANDYAIPGLELDSHGLCPMCRTEEKYRYAKNVMPVLRTIPRSPDRRYDAAVFYTGGKDSSYLLYQLARVQKLRVLSLTWETPFISDCQGEHRTCPGGAS